ncbi:hypothetical protein ACLB2K_073402 [Fragaria x ananassa]
MENDQTQSDSSSTTALSEAHQQHADAARLNDVVREVPLVSSYNEKIRPLLDAVDKLRNLMVMDEGIQLPAIVVVGDQSSGKSSVLESLASISLPRGQEPELSLEYNGRVERTDEARVAEDIAKATNDIAGGGKGISNTPMTLLVKKNGVPDLTMVDLPGITRVPVQGQPENIYDQIKHMIMEYIKPEESNILNVLSATVDFTTCESIRMSRSVDKTGERTLAVVTKVDKAPEGLVEKVTADDVNIGLGYVCVRNRIGEETYEEARAFSDLLFQTHPLLSRIDKSMVGVHVLAQKLVKIQATSIARNLLEIVKKIDDKLNSCLSELNKLPKGLSSFAEAMTAFMQIIGSSKESLKKILCDGTDLASNFLMEEIRILEEAKGIRLPNFLPRNAFLVILQGKVKGISSIPIGFVEKIWSYIEDVVISVLLRHSENYHQLQLYTKRAGCNLIEKMKERSINWMMEIVNMEKQTDYTCNPEYVTEWNRLMTNLGGFIHAVLEDEARPSQFDVDNIGMVDVEIFWQYSRDLLTQAFDLKMRMIAYWKVFLRRLVDSMALHLQLSVANLVNKEMEMHIVTDLMGPNNAGGLEKKLEVYFGSIEVGEAEKEHQQAQRIRGGCG